jgi:clan AA aspartic protease (TIGR02281 family)
MRSSFPSFRQALLIGTALVALNATLCVSNQAHAGTQGGVMPSQPSQPSQPSPKPAPDGGWDYDRTITRQPDQMLPDKQQPEWERWGLPDPHVTPSNQLMFGGGVWHVQALVNGNTKVTFVLDSGSADVSVSPRLFRQLVQDGTVTKSDMRGWQDFRTANGQVVKARMFVLKSVQIGDKIARDVLASVADGVTDDGMLLGQTFLAKFDSWSVDNKNNKLVLN